YERYFEENGIKYEHILSPQTGMPVETDLCSVTVIASADTPNGGIYTDLLATAVYSGGTSALLEFMEKDSSFGDTIYGIVAADKNNNVYVSSGVDFTLYENSGFRLKENL
ncbi:MAG: FAD:protein FMN transferase, partial [Oscillospiraceae bacterium]